MPDRRAFETSEYFPEKVNTQILNVLDRTNIQIEIYERGVGYTLASGSCACAAASAAYRLGLADPHMYVHMPGGTLEVEIKEDGMVLHGRRGRLCGTYPVGK